MRPRIPANEMPARTKVTGLRPLPSTWRQAQLRSDPYSSITLDDAPDIAEDVHLSEKWEHTP